MHTLVRKLVALSVWKYHMALTEIQLKICRLHGSLSQKSCRPLCSGNVPNSNVTIKFAQIHYFLWQNVGEDKRYYVLLAQKLWGTCPPINSVPASGSVFDQLYPALGTNPMSQIFRSSFFLETRLSSESLEPLLGFLAYLEPKLWIRTRNLVKNCTPWSC